MIWRMGLLGKFRRAFKRRPMTPEELDAQRRAADLQMDDRAASRTRGDSGLNYEAIQGRRKY
jgi:hypothetical protein